MRAMIFARVFMLLFGLLLFFASTARAQYPVINAEQLQTDLKSNNNMLLIDSRMPEEYEQAHIPAAVSIPAHRMNMETAKLPKDKTTLLVFYCRGLGCTLSKTAASAAVGMGYTHIRIYQAGMPDWLLKSYPVVKGKLPGKLK